MASDRYIYEHIINALLELIRSENYVPGDPLPPLRELARRFECNLHTVRKAIAFLDSDGVIETRPRSGNFVRRKVGNLIGRTRSRVQLIADRRIGLLLFPAVGKLYSELLVELESEASKQGIQLELQLAADWNCAAEALHLMKNNNCGAVILLEENEFFKTPESREFLNSVPLPLVLSVRTPGFELWCYEPPELYSRFSAEVVKFQVKYFEAIGVRRIVYCGRPLFSGTVKDKYPFYRSVMQKAGLPVLPQLVAGDEPGLRVGLRTLRGDGCIGVIASDDFDALQLVLAAARENLRIPEDVAVMGMNDSSFANYLLPRLSSIRFPLRYLAQRQICRALELAAGKLEFSAVGLPIPELIVRESCGGCRRFSPEELTRIIASLGGSAVIPESC